MSGNGSKQSQLKEADPRLLEKVPPQNLEAEQSTLGSMMIDRSCIDDVAAVVRSSDFYREPHGIIFETISALVKQREPIDIVTVQEALRSRKQLEIVGGTEYLLALIDSVPSSANAGWYAGIVKQKSDLRRLIDTAYTIISQAHKPDAEAEEILAYGTEQLTSLAMQDTKATYTHISEFVDRALVYITERMEDKREITGIPFGIPSLDRFTTGLQNGDSIIVAARPSQGKTALLLQAAKGCAKHRQQGVGIFSIEMSGEQLVLRLITSEAFVSSWAIRTGNVRPDDWTRITDSAGMLYNMPIFIRDLSNQHIRQIPVVARRMVTKENVGLLMLDYIQLVDTDQQQTREREVAYISKQLKQVARELKVPFVTAAQLNRAVEYRQDKEPQLSDLRESGQIEADADVVLLIHNPKPKEDPDGNKPRPATIFVAKQRNLATGRVGLHWDGRKQLFYDQDDQHIYNGTRLPYADGEENE